MFSKRRQAERVATSTKWSLKTHLWILTCLLFIWIHSELKDAWENNRVSIFKHVFLLWEKAKVALLNYLKPFTNSPWLSGFHSLSLANISEHLSHIKPSKSIFAPLVSLAYNKKSSEQIHLQTLHFQLIALSLSLSLSNCFNKRPYRITFGKRI